MTTVISTTTKAFVYSVIKAVPNPRRQESVNIGVVVISTDGQYADCQMARLSKVHRIDKHADLDAIQIFTNSIEASLPLSGEQGRLMNSSFSALNADTLTLWSQEFGGMVQLTEPRSVLSDNPPKLLKSLFSDFVGTVRVQRAPRTEGRPVLRSDLLRSVDKAVPEWRNHAVRSISGASVRGAQAHHYVDRILGLDEKSPLALIEAISFEAVDLTEIYAHRATICVAAEDMHEVPRWKSLPAFAIHTSSGTERLQEIEESAQLFNERGVTPILVSDLTPIQARIEHRLAGPLQVIPPEAKKQGELPAAPDV